MTILRGKNWLLRWNSFGWRWPHKRVYRREGFVAYYFGPFVVEVEE